MLFPHRRNNNNKDNNKVGGRKIWEVIDMFSALMVVMVSWIILEPKLIEFCTLCIAFYMPIIPRYNDFKTNKQTNKQKMKLKGPPGLVQSVETE